MTTTNEQTPQAPAQNTPQLPADNQQSVSPSQRFAERVAREFAGVGAGLQMTDQQKKLAQNYYIKIDMILKATELRRLSQKEDYRDPVPVIWQNVNLEQLALDVVSYSAVGLDPMQPNHLNPIPYKNNRTGKYDVQFIMGYRGIEIKAKKYGLNIPDHVIVELVYSKDKFVPHKRDANNEYDTYEFEITDPFDRGELRGGFYYHLFNKEKERNKLVIMTKADIEKRRPDHAAAEFWGGEKTKWVDGKPAGKVQVEGWKEEMWFKTVYRAAYNSITIDSQKIDDNWLRVKALESSSFELQVANQIAEEGNGADGREPLEITPSEVVEDLEGPLPNFKPQPEPEAAVNASGELFNEASGKQF